MNILQDLLAAGNMAEWRSLDDGVMGGKSQSRMEWHKPGHLVFSGEVSLENNGGFASVHRSVELPDWSGYQGLRLRVRGDGKRYSLRLRMAFNIGRVSYAQAFDTTTDQWMEVFLPFAEFQPRRRGQLLPDEPPLDPAQLRRFGFLIADGQAGPFQLEVAAVDVYS